MAMTQAPLLDPMLALLPDAIAVARDDVAQAPSVPGAYALLIHVEAPVDFARRATGPALLSGWFVYAGSAYGSGGLRARLGRHVRAEKTLRWHVDALTNGAAHVCALAMPGGSECGIVARLTGSGAFVPALPGFGSSDCPRCTAHLLRPTGAALLHKR
jgi:Uri superfamily endonuclease